MNVYKNITGKNNQDLDKGPIQDETCGSLVGEGQQPPGVREPFPRSSGSSSSDFSGDSVAYHPPNLAELSAMIRSPTRGFYSGTSLLYSTSGFDMLGVIARVGKLSLNLECVTVRELNNLSCIQLRDPTRSLTLAQLVRTSLGL